MLTKPITQTAAIILVDRDKLRLNQPVGDFLPQFASATALIDSASDTAIRAATRTITFCDFKTHT